MSRIGDNQLKCGDYFHFIPDEHGWRWLNLNIKTYNVHEEVKY